MALGAAGALPLHLLCVALVAWHVYHTIPGWGPTWRIVKAALCDLARKPKMSSDLQARWIRLQESRAHSMVKLTSPVLATFLLARIAYYWCPGCSLEKVSEGIFLVVLVLYAAMVTTMHRPSLLTVRGIGVAYDTLMLLIIVRICTCQNDTFIFVLRGVNVLARMWASVLVMDIRRSCAWNIAMSLCMCFAGPRNINVFRELYEPSHKIMVLTEWITCFTLLWVVRSIEVTWRAQLQANAELDDTRQAMHRILGAVCDAVLQLDEGLHIRQPSPQLCNLLLGGVAAPASLEARDFTSFAFPWEQDILRNFLAEATRGHSNGAAAALHIQLKCADGNAMHVELFHAAMSGTGSSLHLLGLRQLAAEVAGEAPAPAQAVAAVEDLAETEAAAVAEAAPAAPPPDAAPGAEGPAAVCFNALSTRLDILGHSPIFGLAGLTGPAGLLDWLPPEISSLLDDWVEALVRAAPPDRHTVSKPSAWPVVLRIFADIQGEGCIERRWTEFHSAKAWVEIPPLDDCDEEGVIPVTLMLQGVTLAQRAELVQPPAARSPVGGGAADDRSSMGDPSTILPFDSVSCAGLRLRR